MNNIELKIWKEELLLQKDKNVIKLKEITRKLDKLNARLTFMLGIKEQLQSTLLQKVEEDIAIHWNELENIKKENKDIKAILCSIDTEIGAIFICR